MSAGALDDGIAGDGALNIGSSDGMLLGAERPCDGKEGVGIAGAAGAGIDGAGIDGATGAGIAGAVGAGIAGAGIVCAVIVRVASTGVDAGSDGTALVALVDGSEACGTGFDGTRAILSVSA